MGIFDMQLPPKVAAAPFRHSLRLTPKPLFCLITVCMSAIKHNNGHHSSNSLIATISKVVVGEIPKAFDAQVLTLKAPESHSMQL